MEQQSSPNPCDDSNKSIKQDCEDAGRRRRATMLEISPDIERRLMKCPNDAYLYARDIINGRWEEAEPIIRTWDAPLAYRYARDVIKGRWPEAEPIIFEYPDTLYEYVKDVIKGRCPEAERLLLEREWSTTMVEYSATIMNTRWPEAEETIAANAVASEKYLDKVLRHDWNEEAAGLCPLWAYNYAKDVIGGRLPAKLHNKMMLWKGRGENVKHNRYVRLYLTSSKYK